MITLEDCIAFSGLTEAEIMAIAEHEHVPEIAAAALGHDGLGEAGERIATLIGAGAIAVCHVRNYLLCRRARCAHQ